MCRCILLLIRFRFYRHPHNHDSLSKNEIRQINYHLLLLCECDTKNAYLWPMGLYININLFILFLNEYAFINFFHQDLHLFTVFFLQNTHLLVRTFMLYITYFILYSSKVYTIIYKIRLNN